MTPRVLKNTWSEKMSWAFLAAAILFEVAGTTFLKLSNGFTRLLPVIFMFLFYAASMSLLSLVLKKIEVGIAYAIWSGVGTATITLIGIMFFREGMSVIKLGGILLIIAGVTILNLSGSPH
jgi:small multidrug resistance pump